MLNIFRIRLTKKRLTKLALSIAVLGLLRLHLRLQLLRWLGLEVNNNAIKVPLSITSWKSPHELDCKELSESSYSSGDLFVKTTTPTPFVMNIHGPKRDEISASIAKDGCWECNHVKSMLTALDKYPNSYFLDVGGNIGMWTLSAAAANKQTFTIEPSIENYSRICKTVNLNGFHNRIHLMNIAASKEAATFQLMAPKKNKGGTQLMKDGDTRANVKGVIKLEGVIKAVTIDSLKLPTDIPVVMKIDVEGHEYDALSGAMKFLEDASIVYLAIELRPLDGRVEWNDIFKVLTAKGLVPFRVDNGGVEVKLDPNNLSQWKHPNHPMVRFYDVVWRMEE